MGETDEVVDTTDRVKPWTVKGIAPEERNAAIAAADREDLTIGEWLTRAIRTQVKADHQSDRLPVALDPPSRKADTRSDRQADLVDLERMVALAQTLATANGQPIPVGITRATYSLMREHLKALKAGWTAAGV
jgi:hypothetical protein